MSAYQDKSANPAMPVIADVRDFDVKSGNLAERVIFNHRALVITLCVVATVVLGWFATRLNVNASFERMIPPSSPYVKNYLAYKSDLPGLGNTIRIVVENKTGNIYDKDYLEALRKVNDTLYLIPGTDRSWMKSLWMPIVRWRQVTEEGVVGGAVMPADYSGTRTSIEQLKTNISRANIIGSLVANDLKSSMIVVPLLDRTPGTGQPLNYGEFSRALEAKVRVFESDKVGIHIIGFGKIVGDLIAGLHLILLVGDVTYANLYLTNGTGSDCYSCSFSNTPIQETYQPRWDYWGRYMEPLIASVPIMVVEGNHEIEEQAENKTFVAYSSRFAFPSEESGSSSTFYYSFNAGGIHFIMLGAYISYDKSGDQYKWLEKDLASLDREVTPWLVATWHAPWYSTYIAHYREVECMRVEMEDLLYKYGVDIVFNGHVHAYERSNRVYNYTLDPCGPVYITVGDGGNREKMAIAHADEPGNCPEPSTTPDKFMGGFCAFNFTSGPAAGKFCWDQQPDYSAFRESSFGHGILEVKNETHALWIWHRNQDFYGSAGDEIYIVRQPDKCPPVKPEENY